MPAGPDATAEHIRDVNVRYHDEAAASYDAKWGIDFGSVGQGQVLAKLVKILGRPPERPFEEALEIGAGTGYFSLNLMLAGAIQRLTATDISPGMLSALEATAVRLGLAVSTEVSDAERLPFNDRSFDLVFGHAILHHLPDLSGAMREFHRVLRPGGTLLFCGEPSRHGDRLASLPKRSGRVAGPLWRRLVGASASSPANGASAASDDLEGEVDVHAFSPRQLESLLRDAGFVEGRVRGEELVANAYGWVLRSLESTADPATIPRSWRRFAFRSYLALQRFDARWLEPNLPAGVFYNLLLSARKPQPGGPT
jgi:ubiquinone/menaquinone biosynthesis C-methylase UbiE